MFIWRLGVHLGPDMHLETRYPPGFWCSLEIGVQLWPNDHLGHGVYLGLGAYLEPGVHQGPSVHLKTGGCT